MFYHALGFFNHHFGHLDVAGGGFVESGGDDFAAYGTAHFGYFFRAFVNQQDDEFGIRVVGGDGMGDVLQHHGFARFGRGNQKCTLSASDWGDEVDGAAGEVFFRLDVAFQLELFGWEERGKVFEEDFVFADFGVVALMESRRTRAK